MRETTSQKGMGVKDADLNNFGNESVGLKVKGAVHKYYTLVNKVASCGGTGKQF